MRNKLIKSQFVTEDLYVRCSLKEYNEYRRFLENEFMKVCAGFLSKVLLLSLSWGSKVSIKKAVCVNGVCVFTCAGPKT